MEALSFLELNCPKIQFRVNGIFFHLVLSIARNNLHMNWFIRTLKVVNTNRF
jgi:hypothetical protein